MFNVVGSLLVATPLSESLEAAQLREKAGLKQFLDMAYSRDVEKEDDFKLVQQERLFSQQLTDKLDTLNSKDVHKLIDAMDSLDFKTHPILHHPDLPYLVMEALRRGLLDPEHGTKQAATVLNFWGTLRYFGSSNDLQTIEIFHGGAPNEQAVELMKQTFETDNVPFLSGDKFDVFMENLRKLPPSEQRFLLVPDDQGVDSLSTIAEKNGGDGFKATISQVAKEFGINVFNRVSPEMRMIPSIGMKQAFLDAQYDQPVEIKPRIYLSTVMQIRECGQNDTRDMMVPFPDASSECRCPQKADGYKAPWFEFPYHDFYHAIIASAVGKIYRGAAVFVADVIAAYAKEPGTENREGLLQLSSYIIDIEFNHFLHFLRDPETSLGQLFWDTIVTKVHGWNGTVKLVRRYKQLGLPVPFEFSPISDENIGAALEKIYHGLTVQ